MAKVCQNHPDAEATASCAVCGKTLCDQCRIDAEGMVFCSEECKDKGLRANTDTAPEAKKCDGNEQLIRKLIYLFIVIALLAIVWFYYSQNKKRPAGDGRGISTVQPGAPVPVRTGK